MRMNGKKKDKYYNPDAINKIDSQYKLIIGEKSNGKSYAIKLQFLRESWETGIPFVFIRRYVEDVKLDRIEGYFADMVENDDGKHEISELTDGKYDCVQAYRGSIYFAKTTDDGPKRGFAFARFMAIPQYEHFTSQAFVKVNRILFEEFIAPLGKPFLPNEYNTFMLIVSTIFRRRRGCVVYMIANTNKIICPYFNEWGIQVSMLEQGKISVFHHDTGERDDETGEHIVIDIAVEWCENSEGQDRMVLGRKRTVLTKGEWDTNSYPHLQAPYKTYRKWYTVYYKVSTFVFVIRLLSGDNRLPFLYIYPYKKGKEIPENARIVSDSFSLDVLTTSKFDDFRTKYDELVYKLLMAKRMCYSDNMSGTTFNELLRLQE